MAARLICTRVQVEVDHQGTIVLRGHDVIATIMIRLVVREELCRIVVVDADTMGQDAYGCHRLRALRIH